ncbi:hypothetical protein TNCV_246941 [Trichonephila clavipes]|nr:hypothetical protein TNCV_246941 [Trichonephila clavipes]
MVTDPGVGAALQGVNPATAITPYSRGIPQPQMREPSSTSSNTPVAVIATPPPLRPQDHRSSDERTANYILVRIQNAT